MDHFIYFLYKSKCIDHFDLTAIDQVESAEVLSACLDHLSSKYMFYPVD